MKRRTISIDEFRELRSGDLVIWRGRYFRTISKGPADEREQHRNRDGSLKRTCCAVEFAIRRRTWRERPSTIYFFNDVSRVIRRTGLRSDELLLDHEWAALAASGFGVADVVAELRKQEEQRGGRPLCKAYPRIRRLIAGLTNSQHGKARARTR